jgi:hypothetical protein
MSIDELFSFVVHVVKANVVGDICIGRILK